MAPILVFPTLLLALQTGGAGGAINLPGFPPVQSFLQFMLAGAMMQSLMLAGNSGGIALAVDIEMGFTDRLFSAPIPRYTIVLGRLAGTAALGPYAPLALLQPWMKSVAEVNPVTQVLDAARQGFVGEVTWAETWPGIVALLGLLALLGALALREMRRTAV